MTNSASATPLFSVVIPTFNRSRLVAYAVDSILRQTFADFEVVVCDNCSADDTADVIARITDARVRYVRTPAHWVIADSWEFARSQARGCFVLMLSDDDVLVRTALESFAREARHHDADFLFCGVAEYRDLSFPGDGRNTLSCVPFGGESRAVSLDDFVAPLFSFRQRFNMHPSAFAFARALADRVAGRCGRFFQTNGVEYCAWTLAAALAKRIVQIDAPLCVCGRTGASWGSNIALANPGQERIEQFIADVERQHKHAPLSNFTMCNLWAEGALTAKKLLPMELGNYEFDEPEYLRATMRELLRRRALAVDVSRDLHEVTSYTRKSPALARELEAMQAQRRSLWSSLRSAVGRAGGRAARIRVRALRDARRVRRGEVTRGFTINGADLGFDSITGCAEFLAGVVTARG